MTRLGYGHRMASTSNICGEGVLPMPEGSETWATRFRVWRGRGNGEESHPHRSRQEWLSQSPLPPGGLEMNACQGWLRQTTTYQVAGRPRAACRWAVSSFWLMTRSLPGADVGSWRSATALAKP